MKFSFTLSQLELFALSETRYWDFVTLSRSYRGIKDGVHYDAFDSTDYLMSDELRKYSYNADGMQEDVDLTGPDLFAYLLDSTMPELHVSMRRQEFGVRTLKQAHVVHIRMAHFQTALRDLKNQTGPHSQVLKAAKAALRSLKEGIDATEW